MLQPTIFIGSSVENLNIAEAIQINLAYEAECVLWSQGVFDLSKSTLESLIDSLNTYDFAIFVLNPDDLIHTRDVVYNVVRDNVIFELGLFFGKLGRDAVFFLTPMDHSSLHLPSDLLGITSGVYNAQASNIQASLGAFCTQVKRQIKKQFLPEFPETDISNKTNLLHEKFINFTSGTKYCFSSKAPFDLRIEMLALNSTPGNAWFYSLNNKTGWIISDFDFTEYSQSFLLPAKEKGNLEVNFEGSNQAQIKFYKNGQKEPFTTKEITWTNN